MSRLALSLIIIFALFPSAQAIQLGDSREQTVAQYGNPTSGNLDQGLGTYRWAGWRLDVEVMQGVAQRLIFTKAVGAPSEAEECQLLNDNGGVTVWKRVDDTIIGWPADKKWRRVTDGAEAATLSMDRHGLCLVTKAWVDAKKAAMQSSMRRPNALGNVAPKTPVVAPAIYSSPEARPGPVVHFIAGLIVLAGLTGFLGFVGWVIVRFVRSLGKRVPPLNPAAGDLWTPTKPAHLKSACTVATPPPLPAVSACPPIPNLPKQKTLEDLSWQEFELMIGELYRRQGYAVEMCSGDGSDGGVDLWLRKEGKTVLVQCKHWKVYKVGVSPVRELFGILAAEKADHALFVTTGRFTQDARSFAAGKAMELIDGEQLRVAVEALKFSAEGDLLDVAGWSGNFARTAMITTPVCPFCHSAMVLRRGKQSGNQFWGCSTYPGCRGKRNVRPELMGTAAP